MKKIKIIIFGTGSHASVILSEILRINKYKIEYFVDPNSKKNLSFINLRGKKYKVFKNLKDIKNMISRSATGIIAIGDNKKREKISKEVNSIFKKFNWIKLISKNAILSTNVTIGEGSVVITGATINTGTKIGKHCLINTNSSIDHDNEFKDFSGSGPGVTTGGNVKVGKKSYLGIGCTINNSIKIEDNVIIGAQSFVNKNCKKNSLYFGVPAKKIKNIK